MKAFRTIWLMSMLVLAAMVAPARAVTVSFDSAGAGGNDASMFSTSPTTPWGLAYSVLEVGNLTSRSVVQFDVSSITGAYSTIDAITLRLTTSYNQVSTIIDIHEVVNSWVESQVTWNDRQTATPWTAAGGDFAATVLGSINSGSLTAGAGFDSVSQQVTVSLLPGAGNAAARKALIDSWTSGSNEGLLLKESIEVSSGGLVGFRDRSRGPAAERPLLTVEYTAIPEPSSLMLLGFGLSALTLVRRRSR